MSSLNPVATSSGLPEARWPTPLSLDEWDELFPGILDGILAMAGSANVIMQLARQGVGYGVMESRVESGSLFKHPVKRARTTFTYLAVAMLGSTEEKLAYRKAVNRSHAQVHSLETSRSPVKYNAFDPELQMWVAACLYWGIADSYGKIRGPLDHARAARLYELAQPLGTTLQVRAAMWPKDLADFNTYWERNLEQLHIDDTIRAYLMALVDLKFLHPLLRLLFGRYHRFITTGFLPPRLREEMRLPWGPSQQKRFDRTLSVFATLNGYMPRIVRQMPFRIVIWDFRRRQRKGLPMV